jgi:hypothetical protein
MTSFRHATRPLCSSRITLNFANFAEHPSQISIIQQLRNSTRNNTVIEYHVGTFTIPQPTFEEKGLNELIYKSIMLSKLTRASNDELVP